MNVLKNDVIKVDLSGAIGSEQGKIRYAVVIQNNKGNLNSTTTIIIPLTHIIKSLYIPTHALITKNRENGLKVDSMLLWEQIRVISEQRIIEKVGKITDKKSLNAIRKVYNANFDEL